MPRRIKFNQFIHPAKLSSHCKIPHLGGQSVIAAGMGRVNADEWIPLTERRLRHAHLETIFGEDCGFDEPTVDTIICTRVNGNGQSTTKGDSGISLIQQCCHPIHRYLKCFHCEIVYQFEYNTITGGPLLLESDGSFIGVTSIGVEDEILEVIDLHVFTNIQYYYGWIERETGLKLPICEGPQAESFYSNF